MFVPSHLYTGSGSDQKSTGSGSATLHTEKQKSEVRCRFFENIATSGVRCQFLLPLTPDKFAFGGYANSGHHMGKPICRCAEPKITYY